MLLPLLDGILLLLVPTRWPDKLLRSATAAACWPLPAACCVWFLVQVVYCHAEAVCPELAAKYEACFKRVVNSKARWWFSVPAVAVLIASFITFQVPAVGVAAACAGAQYVVNYEAEPWQW